MKFFRRVRLARVSVCLCASWLSAGAQQQSPTPQPATGQQTSPQQKPEEQKPPAQPQPAPRPTNPFETVPTGPGQQPQAQPQQPAQPRMEAPKAAEEARPAVGQVVEGIEFRGARRVPQDTLKALIYTKTGDIFNEDTLRRDFMALWNTGRFDDIRLETEPGRTGLIVRFVVTERRVIRSIDYQGMKSVTVSEVLDRFKERKVGLSVESQYDPNKIQRGAVVLKEYLAERGRQYATVDPVIEQIPPSSLKLTFNVNEGPKVKVGSLNFVGNKTFNRRWILRHMKGLRPTGIPHSILFEDLFSKTYDKERLEYDKYLIQQAYQDQGYYMAKALDETVKISRRGGTGWKLPLLKPGRPSILADVTLPIEEGRQYHLNSMNFQGVKVFREPSALQGFFGMRNGDVFSTDKLKKGIENLRKYYGMLGYIDFVPEPDIEPIPDTDKIDITLTADEGKQFFIRRIDFSGNTTTRDKVIRREILLDEGDIFNTQLWDLSILRLNQLGYFEMLKKEDAADIKRNPQSNTVDITLKVKERGKNSIGLNGGVSGIAGSFMGFNYSTNNFLGLGETLSLETQLGTRMRDVSVGFTEPYFLDRPLQLGFVVYLRRFSYDQGREASILAGQNLIGLYNELGAQNLLNYVQNSHGFSVSASYPVRHSFARLGITYGFDVSTVKTLTAAATSYFDYINFSGVAGPNSLKGIRTSHIVPSYSYNTVNHPINPTAGRSIFASVDFAGSLIGGNVNTIRPTVDFKYFRPSPLNRNHVLAFHAMSSWVTGYGGKYVPPYTRTFIGGEQDVRGFEIWGITPIAYISSASTVNVLNADGSTRMQKVVSGGTVVESPVKMNVPSYQLITPGGDFQTVVNFEYRIPIIANTVTLSPFGDFGINRILLTDQLTMDTARITELNGFFPQAGFTGRVKIAEGTQRPRASVGLELGVMLPVVNAPFRIYFAANPLVVRQDLKTPIVLDRSMFPNEATYQNSVNSFGQTFNYREKRTMFRFTIGKTF